MAGTDIKNADNIDAVQFVIQSTHVAAAPAGHARLYRLNDGAWYEADENGQGFARFKQPCARVRHSANQSIASGGMAKVLTFNTEDYDTDSIHDNGVAPSRLTCQTAGLYLIIGQAEWQSNTSGRRALVIRLNGTTYIAISDDIASGPNGQVVMTTWLLGVGDYIELMAFQDSGTNLNVIGGQAHSPVLAMCRIG